MRISQGDSSVIEYAGRFNQLSRFAKNFVVDEKDRAVHFERGLRPDIHFKLSSLVLITYRYVLERAIKVEQSVIECDTQSSYQQKRPKFTNFQESRAGGSNKQKGINRPGKFRTHNTRDTCNTCGKYHGGECYRKTGTCVFLCESGTHAMGLSYT